MRHSTFFRTLLLLSVLLSTTTLSFAQDSLNVARWGMLFDSWEYPYDAVDVGQYIYVATGTPGLSVLHVSQPDTLIEVNTQKFSQGIVDVDAGGGYVVVCETGTGFHLLSLADPAFPEEVGSYLQQNASDLASHVAIHDTIVFLGNEHTVDVVSISDPASPTLITRLTLFGTIGMHPKLTVFSFVEPYLMAGNLRDMYAIDPSYSADLLINGSYPQCVTSNGRLLYVGNEQSLQVYDLDGASGIELLRTMWLHEMAALGHDNLMVCGDTLWVSNGSIYGGEVSAYSLLADSTYPQPLNLPTAYEMEGLSHGLLHVGGRIYDLREGAGSSGVAQDGFTGFYIYDRESFPPVVTGTYQKSPVVGIVAGHDRSFVAKTDALYQLVAIHGNPQVTASIPFAGTVNAIAMDGDLLIVLAKDGQGKLLKVLNSDDLSERGQLRFEPDYVSFHPGCLTAADGFAYLTTGGIDEVANEFIRIVDLSDPYNPVRRNEIQEYYNGSIRSLDAQNGQLYVVRPDSLLNVYDVSNVDSPSMSGSFMWDRYTEQKNKICVSGDYGAMSQFNANVLILDISNPANINVTTTYTAGGTVEAMDFIGNNQLLVAGQSFGVEIINLNSLSEDVLETVGYNANTSGEVKQFARVGEYLYLATDQGLEVYTLSGSLLSASESSSAGLPAEFTIRNIWPNPFNQEFAVQVDLPVPMKVKVELYNLLGRQVFQMARCEYAAGTHRLQLNADHLSSGLYFLRVSSLRHGSAVRKITLLR